MAWAGKIRPERILRKTRKNIASFLVPETTIAELPIQGGKSPPEVLDFCNLGYSEDICSNKFLC